MRTAILGAGAMGSVIGSILAEAGADVVLVDISQPIVDAIRSNGLVVVDKEGNEKSVRVAATTDPAAVGQVDLLVVFVKCYHTEAAVGGALSLLKEKSIVLSLQNGWGNAARIGRIVGLDRVLLGVSYHSATLLAPGRVRHGGEGPTYLGEPNGTISQRAKTVADFLSASGLEVEASTQVLKEIWSKLALNVATLPTSVLARLTADQLLNSPEMQTIMQTLLREVVSVAEVQRINLDFNERWDAITGLLRRLAPNTKGSMLQDIENKRRTEIDVINGAVVEIGELYKVATPYNRVMVGLVKALETGFQEREQGKGG
jgi:2-dehydropantoate 2-reductase